MTDIRPEPHIAPDRSQAAPTSLQRLPSIDQVLQWLPIAELIDRYGRAEVLRATRLAVAHFRAAPAGQAPVMPLTRDAVLAEVDRQVSMRAQPLTRQVFNLTGTVLHTNLGRALLPQEAVAAMMVAATEPVNLEYSITTGQRGDRDSLVESLLIELTGAEAATVVNNNAAAVLLTLSALAGGREALLSRGEMVEIGGAFRIPDIMRRARVRLVEVGTTNRTRTEDYAQALTDRSALILRVHASNYQIIGFTQSPALDELCALSMSSGIPIMEDLGSGALIDFSRWGLPKEPIVGDSIAKGVSVVTFSGDKLLGGPQAGIVVGRRALIERIKRDPLKRALRVDKVTLAALEAVLRLYRDPDRLVARLPTLRWLARTAQEIQSTASIISDGLQAKLRSDQWSITVQPCASMIGAGSQPIERLPSFAVVLTPVGRNKGRILRALNEQLRWLPVPVLGRVHADALWLDCRMIDDPTQLLEVLNALPVAAGVRAANSSAS